MNKYLHSFATAVGLLAICIVISGCVNINLMYTVDKDGTITQDVTTESAYPSMKNMLREAEKEQKSNGAEVTDTANGFKSTEKYASMANFIQTGKSLANLNSGGDGIRQRSSFLYDYYTMDIVVQGDGNITKPSGSEAVDSMTQALVDSTKVDFSLQLPHKPDSDNADSVSNNGTLLTWDLRNALFYGRKAKIQTAFKIYHENNLIMLVLAGGFLFVLGVGFIITGGTQTNISQRTSHFSVGIICLLIFFAGVATVMYCFSHPPVLTAADRIDSPPSTTNPFALPKKEKKVLSQAIEDTKLNQTAITKKIEKPVIEEATSVPLEYKMALKSAQEYLETMPFSRRALYRQLISRGGDNYPEQAAQYAIEHVETDYKENAVRSAKEYLETMPMSKAELYRQLCSESGDGYTEGEAAYAVDKVYH